MKYFIPQVDLGESVMNVLNLVVGEPAPNPFKGFVEDVMKYFIQKGDLQEFVMIVPNLSHINHSTQ